MKRRDKQLTEVELQEKKKKKEKRQRLERKVAIATPEPTFSPHSESQGRTGPWSQLALLELEKSGVQIFFQSAAGVLLSLG